MDGELFELPLRVDVEASQSLAVQTEAEAPLQVNTMVEASSVVVLTSAEVEVQV